MFITIHRGAKTIGGNCVELQSGNSRLIIDVGMPLMNPDGSEFDSRPYAGLKEQELVEAGLLPLVEGLYSWQKPSVAGVLISHAHQDHYGLLNYVHEDIPLYMSGGTKKLIEISSIFAPQKSTPQIKKRDLDKNTKIFTWPEGFRIRDFRVLPHLMDHSAFDSFAFEIEAEGKRVFYSGDFRDHGYIGKETLDLIKRYCAPGVDALLMEGTMLGRKEEAVPTEEGLVADITEICRACPKAVLVFQSGQNVSRVVTFYNAALETGRELVLDFYTAHVLSELAQCKGGGRLPCPGTHEGIRVWYPTGLTGRTMKKERKDIVYRFAQTPCKIGKDEFKDRMDKMMLFVRPGMGGDLDDYLPNIEGSVLIYSLWPGYMEQQSTKNFVDVLKGNGVETEIVHTSGHATVEAMQKLVDSLQPKKLFPVHTLYPKKYKNFGVEVEELKDGVTKLL